MTTATPPVEETKPSGGVHLIWKIFYAIFLVMAFFIIGFITFRPILVLPRRSVAPGFAFTNQAGEQLSNEDLRGKIVLYNFTYADCGEACAPSMELMTEMQTRVDGIDTGGVPIHMVTISFDPERDDAEVLTQLAESLGADPEQWSFVTGNEVMLKSVIGGGFSTYYSQRDDGSFLYDPTFMLVDGNGILRGTYRKLLPEPEILERDINLLVEEVHNSKGVNKYAYEAAHLFLCYP